VTEPSHAIFLSYASQDAEAAQKICAALRAAGIEVWFDQSELRGGDAWDRSIRKEIKTCVLFIPVISRHTHERDEGYFRLEWKLAVDRSHLMTGNKAFLLPVVIDDTRDDDENVPDRFREVQWTRLPAGETPPAFVQRVQRLISPERPAGLTAHPASAVSGAATVTHEPARVGWRWKTVLLAVFAVALVGLGYMMADRLLWSKHPAEARVAAVPAAQVTAPGPAPFAPPPHSIAVLPFVNMSGDKDQEYFSDGLTEELLNSLARINELQVAARTSSFSFGSEHPDIATVAHKLNVGAVLEGSVRRSAHTVRVTAQLINAVTGFHIWSQTYDRNLGDVLKLQTEIATAVASALKVTLLRDEAAKIEVGGTHNPAAFDAYLRATKIYFSARQAKDREAAIAGYTEAIRLDQNYALAYAGRSLALQTLGADYDTPRTRDNLDKSQADARKAIALAPSLAEAHLALAMLYEDTLEFTQANEEFERTLALAPGNARVLRDYGLFAVAMGRTDFGLTSLRRALVLDPLNLSSHTFLGDALLYLRRWDEGMAVWKGATSVEPDEELAVQAVLGLAYYQLGDLQAARSSCEANHEREEAAQYCLAVTYDKLGRHADAEAMLEKIRARIGDSGAVDYSDIYAQWGDTTKALDWLETAMRLRDPDLMWLRLDPFADPLRKEPRFQAVERELKFPN
jgi:TolB-like protein/Tfp pilus assembly protein PilF